MDSELHAAPRLRRALGAAETPLVIDSPSLLQEAAEAWASCQALGLDTEFVRERTYRAGLGLVQVSDGETAWLIDPVAIEDLGPLAAVLQDPGIEKVIHSGSEDFEVLYHQLGAKMRGVVDSQIACAMLGQSLQLGYHHAASWLLEVEIEKDHTRSNWLKRPLSAGQLRYAALDVVLLPLMMERLRKRLGKLGRWSWLLEDVARMQQKSIEDVPPQEAWMRIGGAGSLDESERAVLRALAEWREEIALERDIARGFIVSDPALLALAKRRPDSKSDLKAIDSVHPKVIDRYGSMWLELIRQAHTRPDVPALSQLTQKHRKWLKAMRTRVSSIANSLNVDAALLASRKELERLIFQFEASGEIPERFTGWRKDVVTGDLLAIMQE